jgi:NitT/TauT family transport system ATP-binding protein
MFGYRTSRLGFIGSRSDAPSKGGYMSGSRMVELVDVSHQYATHHGAAVTALSNVDLRIEPGEFVALVGPSGCGKTTLLNMVAGLERHTGAGAISVLDGPPRAGQHNIGYMLARDCLLPWRRAVDNVALTLQVHNVPRPQRRDRAEQALAALGLAGFEESYPAQLSQGMRQRVALARVFAGQPELLLLDEPFSALDAQTRILVQDAFLKVWEAQRMTVLLVTHDLTEAVLLADRVVLMTSRPGRIKDIFSVDLPRPRSIEDSRSDPRFHEIYDGIWKQLSAELDEQQLLERAAIVKEPVV